MWRQHLSDCVLELAANSHSQGSFRETRAVGVSRVEELYCDESHSTVECFEAAAE